MATLVLPDPSLVVLVGAAGSGKSTLAARLFEPDEIVSSDALRGVVSGDESDQNASGLAFRILYRTLERRIAAGRLTVVDATNTKSQDRRRLIARAKSVGVPIVAIVLDLPRPVVHAQNAGRHSRSVDPEVVDRHLDALGRALDAGHLTTDAFDHVVRLRSPEEVSSLRLERRTAPRRAAGVRPAGAPSR